MTHNISPQLKAHLQQSCTTLALLWKITRTDNKVFTFTNHSEDITYNSITYKSNNTVDISSIVTKSDLSVDNSDIIGYLKQMGVNEADIVADLFDDAIVEILLIDYNKLDYGHLTLKYGYLGEINKSNRTFTAEVRGLTQKLEQNFGILTSPTCRARFCDDKCKINVNSSVIIDNKSYDIKSTGVVNDTSNNKLIIDDTRTEPIGFFNYGHITFTSGLNKNRKFEIKNFDINKILLFLPTPNEIRINDTFEIIAGCDKAFGTCIAKYHNAVNFRGEPHLPNRDRIYETNSTRTSGTSRNEEGKY